MIIDRIRLTAAAKVQLSTLKRRYSLEHNNTICRYALCMSLATPGELVQEELSFLGGLEIDWKTLTTGNEDFYINLVKVWSENNAQHVDDESIKRYVTLHIHRGLSFLSGRSERLEFMLE
ncbi:DNA sulfur modification protein DndE [Pseudomonas protegens]|uniref:DNA sulfur modification protein DndE n=1 Tax=Pseudomonas protegens TaxID=380021 RepID=UPI001B326253|nr:DNA sulfur modification protein DndE [Pseudomonas protegens]